MTPATEDVDTGTGAGTAGDPAVDADDVDAVTIFYLAANAMAIHAPGVYGATLDGDDDIAPPITGRVDAVGITGELSASLSFLDGDGDIANR